MSPERDFDPEHRVGYLLRRAFHRAKGNTNTLLRDIGITPTQAATLMALRRGGSLSQAELGRAIGMEPANVHGLVARLRAAGLVQSVEHPSDNRQVSISLAPRGLKHIDAIARLTLTAAEQTLAPLTPAERATFMRLLGRIALGGPTSPEAPASRDRSDRAAPRADT